MGTAGVVRVLKDAVGLLAGAAAAWLTFPNEGAPDGWGFLGPVLLVPVFWFVRRRGPVGSALGGAFWIAFVTLASQGWLLAFHPLAAPLVLFFQIPTYAALFAVLSWLARRLPHSSIWWHALAWTAFETIRTAGFYSYPYGLLASAFWAYPVTFQSADLVGTAGLTFLLAWTSAWAAAALSGIPWSRLRHDLTAGGLLWAANLGYGVFRLTGPDAGAPWKPALVQQAQDPWRGGPAAYEAGFETLERLSKQALASRPDAVVWSETAFVPSVDYHNRYHDNPDSLRLVRRLEAFLETTEVPFLIGNDHREKTTAGTVVDYNAVLAWNGEWTGRYEKSRLVPFTESFPLKQALPWVYRWLQEADTHFWEEGRAAGPLTLGTVSVGTSICFEDAFPEGPRQLVRAGAQVLVNLTNDAWAPGVSSRNQHLALAVFRSVETRRPLVIAANDGATASVSSRGEVLQRLSVGPAGVLLAEVRLGSGTTWYSQSGDVAPWAALFAVLTALGLSYRRRPVVDKGPQS